MATGPLEYRICERRGRYWVEVLVLENVVLFYSRHVWKPLRHWYGARRTFKSEEAAETWLTATMRTSRTPCRAGLTSGNSRPEGGGVQPRFPPSTPLCNPI